MQMPGLSFSSSSLSTWFCLWSILLFVIPANVNGQSHNATFQWAIDNTLTGLWVNGVRLIDSDTSDIYQFQNIHTQNITLTDLYDVIGVSLYNDGGPGGFLGRVIFKNITYSTGSSVSGWLCSHMLSPDTHGYTWLDSSYDAINQGWLNGTIVSANPAWVQPQMDESYIWLGQPGPVETIYCRWTWNDNSNNTTSSSPTPTLPLPGAYNATFEWAVDNALNGLWVNGIQVIVGDTSDLTQFQAIHTKVIALTGLSDVVGVSLYNSDGGAGFLGRVHVISDDVSYSTGSSIWLCSDSVSVDSKGHTWLDSQYDAVAQGWVNGTKINAPWSWTTPQAGEAYIWMGQATWQQTIYCRWTWTRATPTPTPTLAPTPTPTPTSNPTTPIPTSNPTPAQSTPTTASPTSSSTSSTPTPTPSSPPTLPKAYNATFEWAVDNALTGLWVNGIQVIAGDTSDLTQFQFIHTKVIALTGLGDVVGVSLYNSDGGGGFFGRIHVIPDDVTYSTGSSVWLCSDTLSIDSNGHTWLDSQYDAVAQGWVNGTKINAPWSWTTPQAGEAYIWMGQATWHQTIYCRWTWTRPTPTPTLTPTPNPTTPTPTQSTPTTASPTSTSPTATSTPTPIPTATSTPPMNTSSLIPLGVIRLFVMFPLNSSHPNITSLTTQLMTDLTSMTHTDLSRYHLDSIHINDTMIIWWIDIYNTTITNSSITTSMSSLDIYNRLLNTTKSTNTTILSGIIVSSVCPDQSIHDKCARDTYTGVNTPTSIPTSTPTTPTTSVPTSTPVVSTDRDVGGSNTLSHQDKVGIGVGVGVGISGLILLIVCIILYKSCSTTPSDTNNTTSKSPEPTQMDMKTTPIQQQKDVQPVATPSHDMGRATTPVDMTVDIPPHIEHESSYAPPLIHDDETPSSPSIHHDETPVHMNEILITEKNQNPRIRSSSSSMME